MHKILQQIYFSLHPSDHDDLIADLGYSESSDVLEHCLRQWYEPDAPLTFPSKSINVAVIYSCLLNHHFKQPIIDFLHDPELLFGQDRFFQPYPCFKQEYDHMLKLITYDSIVASKNPSVHKTVEYFNAEFMIGSTEYSLFTRDLA